MSAFSTGQSVGRYRILRKLGSGAMGDVFLAEDPQIERQLAIKTVRVEGTGLSHSDRLQRMVREAKAAGRLIHPNIVTLFDVGEEGDTFYLAFEYVAGIDLAQRLRAEPGLSTGEALRIMRQAASALECAHRQGVVHRDIKPSNLLLDADGNVKVADFGIAKLAGQTAELTVTGSVVGSPHYMSPEQIRGEELDGRSDLFSLGTLFYEMVGGRRPFEGDTITSLIYQILHHEPRPLDGLPIDSVPVINALLRRLMAKERDERFATAVELESALAQAQRQLPPAILAGPARAPMAAVPPAAPVGDNLPTRIASSPSSTLARSTPGPGPSSPVISPPTTVGSAVRERPRRWWVMPSVGGAVAGLVLLTAVVLVFGMLQNAGRKLASQAPGALGEEGVGATEEPAGQEMDGALLPTAERLPAVEAAEPGRGAGADTSPDTPVASTAKGDPLAKPSVAEPKAIPPAAPAASREAPAKTAEPEPKRSPSPTLPAAGSTPAPVRAEPETADRAPAGPAAQGGGPRPGGRPEPFHRRVESGLTLRMEVTPEQAFVLVDGVVIGRAGELAQSGGHRLPDPGEHRVVLRSPGMRDYRLLVDASAAGPSSTPIRVAMERALVSELGIEDLPRYRVQEAIGFRVTPKSTRVLVDGQLKGPAELLNGRGGRWLELDRGVHRVSLMAPGHHQIDIAVEVGSGATEKREVIRLDLPSERP